MTAHPAAESRNTLPRGIPSLVQAIEAGLYLGPLPDSQRDKEILDDAHDALADLVVLARGGAQ